MGLCRYGFVVYGDPNVTDIACAGLNGMRMGERVLTVRRATEVSLPRDPLPQILTYHDLTFTDTVRLSRALQR